MLVLPSLLSPAVNKSVIMLDQNNKRVYSIISVPQITRLLFGDASISSKRDPRNGSKTEERSHGKVRNNKTILKILSFI